MKKLLLLLFIQMTISIFNDEPPAWFGFSETSDNKLYKAEVYTLDEEPSSQSVWKYRVKDQSENILHENIYYHDGYYSSVLSNNGLYFVYINTWFDKDELIYIYSKHGVKILSNKEIKLLLFQLQRTESHYIWLDTYYLEGENILVLNLRVGFTKKINLDTGKVIK